jgi:predicted phosphoribosyltransferase
VAAAVAGVLGAPLDVFVVRKVGVPGHEELAMGAVASGGVQVVNDEVVAALQVPPGVLEAMTAAQEREVRRGETTLRADRPPLALGGRRVLVVDDGLATGSTMQAAVAALRRHAPASVTAAVPVASATALLALEPMVDRVVCASVPEPFVAVGCSYDDFSPTTDDEVRTLLGAGHRP